MVYKNTHELVDSIKRKETTSAEILENLLTQIKSKNSDVNALVTLDVERAMDKAKEADLGFLPTFNNYHLYQSK